MQNMISKTLYLTPQVTSNMSSDFFWSSNFLLVAGRCVCSVVGWSVVGGRWSVVGWSVGRWSVVGGQLVGGFKETPSNQPIGSAEYLRRMEVLKSLVWYWENGHEVSIRELSKGKVVAMSFYISNIITRAGRKP